MWWHGCTMCCRMHTLCQPACLLSCWLHIPEHVQVCLMCVLLSARCSCVQALQRVPLFAGLDPKTKGAIASALGQVSMPKGTAVVTQVGGNRHARGLVGVGCVWWVWGPRGLEGVGCADRD